MIRQQILTAVYFSSVWIACFLMVFKRCSETPAATDCGE